MKESKLQPFPIQLTQEQGAGRRRGGPTTGQGETCGFSGRLKMAARGSAPSHEGFAVELGQSERRGGCQHRGAEGTAEGGMAAFSNGSSGEAGVQA